MRRIIHISVVFFFVSVGKANAQNTDVSDTLRAGISFSAVPTLTSREFDPHTVMIGAFFKKEQHMLEAGIRIRMEHIQYEKYIGARLQYKYFFSARQKIYNGYIFFASDYTLITKKCNTLYYIQNSFAPLLSKTEYNHYRWENFAGYGFNVNFTRHFYAGASCGAGIGFYRDDKNVQVPDNTSLSYNLKGNLFSYGQPALMFAATVGYCF